MVETSSKPHIEFSSWLLLIIISLAVFCVNFNTTAVTNAMSSIQNQLNLSASAAQWTINIYLLTAASLIIIGGQLGDMYGRRHLFLFGIFAFWIAATVIAISTSAVGLLIGRLLQGIGAALVTPSALAIVKVHFPEEHQDLAISAITGAMGLGYALGPSLGGFLTTVYSWKAIFWFMIPILSVVAVLTPFKIKHSPRPFIGAYQTKLDMLGLLLFVFGMVPFVLGLVEGNIWGWTKFATLSLLVGGSLILILFWLVENYTNSPLIDFTNFEKKLFVLSIAGVGNTIFSLLTILYFFNLYTQNSLLLNYTTFESGLAMLPASLTMFMISLFSNKIIRALGLRLAALFGLACMMIGFVLLSFINIQTTYASLWPSLLFCGAGLGLGMSTFLSLGMNSLPAEKAGEASGILSTINFLASIFSISIGSILFSHAGRREVYKLLSSSSEISAIQRGYLDKILVDHQHLFTELLQQLSPVKQQLVISTLQYSALSSLHSVVIMNLRVIIIVSVLTFFLLKDPVEK